MINVQKSFHNKNYEFGNFYIISTPIGNLSDLSFRAKEILEFVELIFCEDKRITTRLLKEYNINKQLIDYHKFNEIKKIDYILKLLKIERKNIALVSDAGTPLISDPGSLLIKKLIENNINVIPIPGPCALISALSVSGLLDENFYFYGFLKNKTSVKKQSELKLLSNIKTTLIFYESPKRLISTLKDIKFVFGDVKICIAKEITKLHESFYRGKISMLINHLELKKINGEYVIIVENNNTIVNKIINKDIENELMYLEKKYSILSNRDLIELVSYKLNIKKNIVYEVFNKKGNKNDK